MRGAWLATILGCWLTLFSFQPIRAADDSGHAGHAPATGSAHEPASPDIFGKSLDLAIWTTVVFLVLLFVLNKYAWGPMLEGLQQREARIRNAIDEAQKAQEEAQRLREQFRHEMAQAEEKARAIQEEARRDAQRFRDEETAKTKADLQAERDRMYRELQTARDQALQQLWNQAAELATLISAKAIRRQLTPEDHRRLADEALAELNQAAAQRQLVRSAVTMEDIKELARHETVMDDTGRRVARVYAEALYNAAAQQNQEGEILEELNALEVLLFQGDPRMQAYVTSTSLGRDRRKAILRAFEGRANELLVNFLYVLNAHDRLNALQGSIIAYQDLYDQRKGRMRVVVRSAVPLADDQLERLRQELRGAFHREPVLHPQIDPDLLGGLVVQVDDWLYDASVRTRLRQLRNQISERSSHEIQSGRDRFSSADGD